MLSLILFASNIYVYLKITQEVFKIIRLIIAKLNIKTFLIWNAYSIHDSMSVYTHILHIHRAHIYIYTHIYTTHVCREHLKMYTCANTTYLYMQHIHTHVYI